MDKKKTALPIPKAVEKLFGGEKSGKIILIVGICGIALIFLSSILPKNKQSEPVKNENEKLVETYVYEMEQKLSEMVQSISGGEKAQVIITLESGYEYIYANDTKQSNDSTEEAVNENFKTKQTDDTQQNYVIVKDKNGSEVALKVTEYTPRVKGVVIVCERGNDDDMAQRITNAVTVALGLPSTSVYVTGLS